MALALAEADEDMGVDQAVGKATPTIEIDQCYPISSCVVGVEYGCKDPPAAVVGSEYGTRPPPDWLPPDWWSVLGGCSIALAG